MPSVQTSDEGPGKCYCNETNICDRFLHTLSNFNQKPTKDTAKALKYHFLILVFSALNLQTS